jgi:nitrite reductase/ring-hydroxylating ferredoxin subunit
VKVKCQTRSQGLARDASIRTTQQPAQREMVLVNVAVAKAKEVPPGTMKGVEVEGHKLLVANLDGQFFAMRSVCNHMGGPLEKGRLEGSVVTCPWHGSKWDVKTGKLVQFPRPLPPEPVYKVTVVEEQIMVELEG